jgi:hypothetical protein
MWPLTRPQRQVLATLAVVAFFVAPSGYVAHQTWKVRQTGHLRHVERELSRNLGLPVRLVAVRYPRPGETLLLGLSLRPEGGEAGEVIQAEQARVVQEPGQLAIEATGLCIRGMGPRSLVRLASALVRRASGTASEPVNLVAADCRLELGPGIPAYRLRDLAGTMRRGQRGPTVTASYRVEDPGGSPRCELVLEDARGSQAGAATLTLRTADSGTLPARVLDPLFASGSWLGDRARVEGELELRQAAGEDWSARFRGALRDVDLAALMRRLAPARRLTGRATVEVERAEWADQPGRGPGWVEAHGVLRAGPGTIGGPLLDSLGAQLGFRLAPGRPGADRGDEDYQALGLRFDVQPHAPIRLAGGLGPEYAPDAVVVGGSHARPLASAPPGPVSVAGLIRVLVPDDPARPQQLIPARYESLVIQRFLPVPEDARRPDETPAHP